MPEGSRIDVTSALHPWLDRLVGLDAVAGPAIAACSGGADSLALVALSVAAGMEPVAVHVDHGLRDTALEEAAIVATAARMLGLTSRSVPVRVEPGPNLEARARAARYLALEAVARDMGADHILVGHTADDQAETVLLNLMRGSGSAGLGAMAVRRGTIVRPLLGLRRGDTEAVCRVLGFTPVRDPMNRDDTFRRVWIRQRVLPLLSDGAGRDLVPVLARQAEILRGESDYLDALAQAAWPPQPNTAPARPLAALPLPLARRAVRQWVGGPPPSLAEVERVLAVARGEIRATQLAGDRRVERRTGSLYLTRTSVRD